MKDQKQNRNKQSIEANTQGGDKVEEATNSQEKTQKSREEHKRQVVSKNITKQRQVKP